MKLLIANRGEIAVRIARTARRLGIPTVALHSALDVSAPHVRACDQAVEVSSYLDIDAVVAAARAHGCTHVHPGYGFLSERAAFARAVEEAGLVLVGPSAEVMDRMGRKDAAREVAVAAGVPVVPTGALRDASSLGSSGTNSASYPVLVKAAAGGGGKGMRIVRSEDEMADALAAAGREARSAFGDDTMLVEKYVESGRHIEVQVIGDTHGTVLHLFERDCSTQRRHQKVLEEAPAPTISDEQRTAITTAAVDLAREVGYVNAGTVEFLLDNDSGEFYFLEMNTRLQVEHPVTELVTGLDLVELQLRVAAGEPFGLTQAEVRLDGHAIEARVYAEDSFHGFLPQAGTTSIVRWPGSRHSGSSLTGGSTTGAGSSLASVRVDHALEPNQVVSTSYDPMLGKVIAHGADREAARLALVEALDETSILGLTTNAGFLRTLVASDEFRDATIDTAWLDTAEVPAPDPDLPRLLVAWVSAMISASDTGHPFQADGFRLGAAPAATVVELDRPVVVDRAAGTVDGIPVHQVSAENHVIEVDVDGRRLHAVVNVQPQVLEVAWEGHRHVFEPADAFADHGPAAGDGTLTSPMPGTVLDVHVAVGDTVVEGQLLGAMEAMKMELALKAPFAGTVTRIGAAAGEQVALGATLFVVEPEDES